MKVKIDKRGRITVPLEIREALKFNDSAFLELDGEKIIITRELDPIQAINKMLDDINTCQGKLEYRNILYEAKKKIEAIE